MITKDETGKWNNHSEDIIAVEPYDPHWADQFASEQQAIRECVDVSIPATRAGLPVYIPHIRLK